LEVELLKIIQISSSRWVASSYSLVVATWKIYEALTKYFEEAKSDSKQDVGEIAINEELLIKITSTAL